MADAGSVHTAAEWLQILGFGLLAGGIGQGIRAIVGFKKLSDTAADNVASVTDLIEPGRLLVSLAIGAIAGALAAPIIITDMNGVPAEQFFAIAAAGYSGADFIEGFMSRVVPKVEAAKVEAAKQNGAVAATNGNGQVVDAVG